jgi:hypothetical protein
MHVRLPAFAGTLLIASLTAGAASSLLGYREGLWYDGTCAGTLDATFGWLLGTLPPAILFMALVFAPIMGLLEYKGFRGPLPYAAGGAFAGAFLVVLFVYPAVYFDWAMLLVIPGVVAGAAWWWMAIRPYSSLPNLAGDQDG